MSTSKKSLDTGLVRELAAILREADLGELEIEHDNLRIRVSKQPAGTAIQAVAAPPPAPAVAAAASPPAMSTTSPDAPASAAPEVDLTDAVTSPMVGTAYLAPEPGAANFIKEGDTVAKGDTLMLVEAMKTFNPVEAPRAGTITKIFVSDAQPVEYGEPLVIIS